MGVDNGKKSAVYAVAGVLIAVIIIAGVYVSGVRFPNGGEAGTGTLFVLITDAPVDLKCLNLTIDSLSIQNADGDWIDLLGGDEVYFNLLEYNEEAMPLYQGSIDTGTYTMLKMHVSTANATYLDDSTVDLRVPSEYIKVLLTPHLEIENGESITVIVDLEPDLSKIAISHSLNLKPTVKDIIGG